MYVTYYTYSDGHGLSSFHKTEPFHLNNYRATECYWMIPGTFNQGD